jgi:uracil-DNA glycosylase
MRLLLEGPDGAGKTTLTRHLAGMLACKSVHHGPLPRLTGPQLFKRYGNALVKREPLVIDRAHPSENIYASVLGRYDRLGSHGSRMLDRLLWGNNGVIIRCLPPAKTCERATEGRFEYVGPSARLWVYDAYARWTPDAPWVSYDWTTQEPAEVLTQARRAMRPNPGPGVGHWNPGRSILIVGEQPSADNPRGHAFVEWGGSSAWLAYQLDRAGIAERDIYVVNAFDRNRRALDPAFLQELKPSAVVALGNVATAWCIAGGVEPLTAPHPQFERRFKRQERSKVLATLLHAKALKV